MGMHYLSARALGQQLVRGNGFVVDKTGYEPATGYALLCYPEREMRQSALSGLTAMDILSYLAMNDELLKSPDHYMIARYVRDKLEFVYDIGVLYNSLPIAREIASRNNCLIVDTESWRELEAEEWAA